MDFSANKDENIQCEYSYVLIATGALSTLFPRNVRGVLCEYPPGDIPSHPRRVLGLSARGKYLGDWLHCKK